MAFVVSKRFRLWQTFDCSVSGNCCKIKSLKVVVNRLFFCFLGHRFHLEVIVSGLQHFINELSQFSENIFQ